MNKNDSFVFLGMVKEGGKKVKRLALEFRQVGEFFKPGKTEKNKTKKAKVMDRAQDRQTVRI